MRVVLFRTPTEPDTYTPVFRDRGYVCESIPALGERLLPDNLIPTLSQGSRNYEAVIITSRRAGDAWVQACNSVPAQIDRTTDWAPWSEIAVYAPGPAVAVALDAGHLPPDMRPRDGETAINAAGLAPIIVDAPPRDGPRHLPYLVLTGDKTLPFLTSSLRDAGREVERVQVYETEQAHGLEEDIQRLARRTDESIWVALFSPSSAGYVVPLLEKAGWAVAEGSTGRTLKIAAIGTTTSDYLTSHGYRVDAIAATPDADGLAAAIDTADAR